MAHHRIGTTLLLFALPLASCASGTRWVNEPFMAGGRDKGVRLMEPEAQAERSESPRGPSPKERAINAPPPPPTAAELADAKGERPALNLQGVAQTQADGPMDGRLVGVFRNTYYDFPAEEAFSGPTTPLMDRSCKAIGPVPRAFHDAVCVQGSGTLTSGATVSFAKRDCSCAAVCPRTGQKICFDVLDREKFPWGRGARGTAITPLRSIAVDSEVIALGTRVYIPEFDGVARSPGGAPHDGCFVAEDRGMKVVGEHVDIFSGNPASTEHLNSLVPSNRGVRVYVGTARCDSLEL